MSTQKKLAKYADDKLAEDVFNFKYPPLGHAVKNIEGIETLIGEVVKKSDEMTRAYLEAQNKMLQASLKRHKRNTIKDDLIRRRINREVLQLSISIVKSSWNYVHADTKSQEPYSHSHLRIFVANLLENEVKKRLEPKALRLGKLLDADTKNIKAHLATLDEDDRKFYEDIFIKEYLKKNPRENPVFNKIYNFKARQLQKVMQEILLVKLKAGLSAYDELRLVTEDKAVMGL